MDTSWTLVGSSWRRTFIVTLWLSFGSTVLLSVRLWAGFSPGGQEPSCPVPNQMRLKIKDYCSSGIMVTQVLCILTQCDSCLHHDGRICEKLLTDLHSLSCWVLPTQLEVWVIVQVIHTEPVSTHTHQSPGWGSPILNWACSSSRGNGPPLMWSEGPCAS